jgi:hypothetical protein
MAWVSNQQHKPAGDAHHFLFFHVPPTNQQPTIKGVYLRHKNVGRPWFTETRVTRYQPFVSVRNARLHSECYTNVNGSNQKCEHIIPPNNIQYLKIHVLIEYDRRPHSDTQTEWNEREVTNYNRSQYVQYSSTSQAG